MLAGLLNGAAFGRGVVDFNTDFVTRNNSGHLILAARVDNFRPVAEFKAEMDRVIREIRESERMEGVDRIWLPGEMEFYTRQSRLAHGIPLAAAVVEGLRTLAAELGLGDRLD
jgi:LDH2 family malate/lactate/ureidoglycolate dehydrogenase